jgi:hypothetical protein
MLNYLLRRSEKNVIEGAYLSLSMGVKPWLSNLEKNVSRRKK